MPEPTERMSKLLELLERDPRDTFALYAVAMEYRKTGEPALALQHLEKVLEVDPTYAYAYFQQGQIHEDAGDTEAARSAYERGVEAATRAGDNHARSELAGALDLLT